MTIAEAAKTTESDQDEVSIDINKFIKDQKEIDPDLPDIDRGILLLSEAIFAHADSEHDYKNIVNDLLAENERNTALVEEFQASEKRWNKWKWAGACLGTVTVALVFFADLFDQSLDTTDETKLTVRRVLISVGAIFTVLCWGYSGFSWKMEGKRHDQYKQRLGLQQPENELIKKLRLVLENWGALKRAQDDYLAEVDVNKAAKQCFKHIKDFPEDKELPPKSCMASITLQLLNDGHPARQTANKIKELEEQLSPRIDSDEDSTGFVDLGQKGTIDFNSSANKSEIEVARQWNILQQQMGGLYIDELYCSNSHICRRNAKKPKT